MRREGTTSFGALVLAFLTSQHHNLHMVLLTFGLGGSGMTFMQVYPSVRRGMMVLSLAAVAMNLSSLRRRPAPPSIRVLIVGSSVLTVGVIAWSLLRFGL
jgi:hypothetical protein